MATSALPEGIYVPTLAFFNEDESVDIATTKKHAIRMAEAGVAGIVVHGSNGEAVHLSEEERFDIIKATNEALSNDYKNLPVLVGCSAESVVTSVRYCKQAHEAGGVGALILPPSYYVGIHAPKQATAIEFFTKVADQSPIPVLIYNYPGASQGLDLTSDTIINLSEHPNIIGCKLTCGNTGKLNRIVAATKDKGFQVFGGSADFIVQTVVGGGSGTIAGMANVSPVACVKLFNLAKEDNFAEARELQGAVAHGDWVLIKGGLIAGKTALNGAFGYGGFARSPLPKPTEEETAALTADFQPEALGIKDGKEEL